MSQIFGEVNDDTIQAAADNTVVAIQATGRGELRVIDFFTHLLLNGHAYQIRAGTVATGVAMDSVLTDTDAEMCVDAAEGTTIIPVAFRISFDDIATATTVKVAVKATGTASNAGTAQVPLPLKRGGSASVATARVQETGAVQVVAETALNTVRLFEYANVNTETPASATAPAALAGPLATIAAGQAQLFYCGKGVACVYVQAAATTAFPLYFAVLDFVELPTTQI